jgi:predicted DNA-binding protein (MmcQ/YjbR family)
VIDGGRKLTRDEAALRKYALDRPETHEDFPWGHRAFKVRKKIFATLCAEDEEVSISVKLPQSRYEALKKSFAEPTHYGMGKHGWVTFRFKTGRKLPMADLQAWIDESYRAIAPKKAAQKSRG